MIEYTFHHGAEYVVTILAADDDDAKQKLTDLGNAFKVRSNKMQIEKQREGFFKLVLIGKTQLRETYYLKKK